MNSSKIIQFLSSEHRFYTTTLLKQHWSKSKYSYMITPRPTYGLILILSGSVKFITEKETLCARAGNLIFLPKHLRYDACFENECEDYLVSFDTDGDEVSFLEPTVLLKSADPHTYKCFRQLVEAGYDEGISSPTCRGLFYMFLSSAIKQTEDRSSPESKILNRACALLSETNGLSVKRIAEECAISERTLRNLFREHMGDSPAKYRNRARIKQAAYLLESTDLSIAEISDRLLFYDIAYFYKVFRAHTGMTPAEYVKNKRL